MIRFVILSVFRVAGHGETKEMRALLSLSLSPKERAVRAILCYAGCRRGAITRLDLRDVKLSQGLLIFRHGGF